MVRPGDCPELQREGELSQGKEKWPVPAMGQSSPPSRSCQALVTCCIRWRQHSTQNHTYKVWVGDGLFFISGPLSNGTARQQVTNVGKLLLFLYP